MQREEHRTCESLSPWSLCVIYYMMWFRGLTSPGCCLAVTLWWWQPCLHIKGKESCPPHLLETVCTSGSGSTGSPVPEEPVWVGDTVQMEDYDSAESVSTGFTSAGLCSRRRGLCPTRFSGNNNELAPAAQSRSTDPRNGDASVQPS
uniref:Uncharacterized protein n=1 Tax=Molossus molossus TaxID=27622 RepID=A0A7J8HCU0_MOLMO|nr:hypothetical protein HJG59_011096 [Molossus molossus]